MNKAQEDACPNIGALGADQTALFAAAENLYPANLSRHKRNRVQTLEIVLAPGLRTMVLQNLNERFG